MRHMEGTGSTGQVREGTDSTASVRAGSRMQNSKRGKEHRAESALEKGMGVVFEEGQDEFMAHLLKRLAPTELAHSHAAHRPLV